MKLSDLIIEGGPYYASQLNPLTAPTTEQLNELREELMAARAVLDVLSRFRLDINFWDDTAHGECLRCGMRSSVSADDTLGELSRWAGEHAEVCR